MDQKLIRRAAPALIYLAAMLAAVVFASRDAVAAVAVPGAVALSLSVKSQAGWE